MCLPCGLAFPGSQKSFNFEIPRWWVVLQTRLPRLTDILCLSPRAATEANTVSTSLRTRQGNRPRLYTQYVTIQALSED